MNIYPKVNRAWPGPPVEPRWRGGHELLKGQAVVRLPLGVLQVRGESRLAWLETVTSQKLADQEPGVSAEALVLDTEGRVELAFFLVDDGKQTWILTEEPRATREFLEAMRFRARVSVTDATAEYTVWGFAANRGEAPCAGALGASIRAGVEQFAAVSWVDPWPGPVGDTTIYTVPGVAHPGQNIETPRQMLGVFPHNETGFAEFASENNLVEADLGAWEAWRISLWRPRLGREGIPGVLPHEVDWLRTAVALNKGCYTGQETVAKMVNRGRPPRRLVFLDLDGMTQELPPVGSRLRLAQTEETVGVLTSVAYHPTDGQIALGLVKRQTDPEALLEMDSAEGTVRAAQTVIVNPSGDNPRRVNPPDKALGLNMRRRVGRRKKLGLGSPAGASAGASMGRICNPSSTGRGGASVQIGVKGRNND